ncbi:hypothetical protein GCM10023229_09810 [Flavisolibacter ginsenosidimutans]
MERMTTAIDVSQRSKQQGRLNRAANTLANLSWTERGPVYDLVGPNGNNRGTGTNYTAGRTAAILVDTLNDPSGNTVFCGGIAGGLWKCTNFLSSIPNWQAIDDRFDNLAISSICQNPANSSVMYFSTGEATGNADAVYGGGVWKSTDGGTTWTRLASTIAPSPTVFLRVFKIVCDATGNVYLANRNTSPPVSSASGLYRSKDGGASWQEITPTVRTSGNGICTDIEISSTGRLHASFGYSASTVQHQYTDDPANVTPASGWNASTGIRINSSVIANRLELAVQGNVLYAVTTNSISTTNNNNVDSCYKSVDGGATWTKQNTTAYTTSLTNTQGWYDLTLAINPSNSNEFLVGGVDAYKSTNSGSTVTRQTYWANGNPYVHADHHFIQWWMVGAQSRIVIGCDGGVFLSNDGGATFIDKNRNLAIKQFYDAGIHPTAGSPYLIAGAQDNGVHAFSNPGLSFSTEVYGGDGCMVHINQQNPQIQFGSYVYNTYRRSTDGGNSWSSVTFGNNNGMFVNPYDYDDGQNVLYATWASGQMLRWADANTSTGATLVSLAGLTGTPSVFKVSPFTKDRVFIGSNTGKLIRLDNAKTVTSATASTNITNITGTSFPAANLSCVNTGSSDNYLVATFSNYGVSHVFYSTDGGTSWTKIDGNLPDMPVRWALFDPQNNSRIFLATEAGVYSTDAVNGSSTVWNADINFPTVRTDVLKMRLSDNTVVAATHGRGLFTAVIPALPELRFNASNITYSESTTGTTDCRGYTDYVIPVTPVTAPSGDATVTYSLKPGNTATEGVDFDYTANGSFANSAKQHTFPSGSKASQNITVRVYDDAAVEPDETFTISFAVSGSTDAFAGSYSTYTITIKDNDFAPTPTVSLSGTLGTYQYNLGSAASANPFNASLQSNKAQFLYKASELNAVGLTAGSITSVGLYLTKNSTRAFSNLNIKMGSTSIPYLVDGGVNAVSTTTYKTLSSYSTVNGLNAFVLDAPFIWDGTSNVVVEVCYDNGSTATNAADILQGYADGGGASQGNMIWQNNINCGTNYTSVGYYASGIKPVVTFTADVVANTVETSASATKTATLPGNADVYFYNGSKIIARIQNTGGGDYGCTQVSIDRAGSSAVAFWNNNPSNYLTSKTLQVVPTTNNPSGQYQITLYYTAAEKAGWEAATGQSWNNIQLVKVKSQIKNYTPGTPAPDGANAVEVVTPTFGTFGSDYTLTATFASGFSGFAAGIPGVNPLPITLLTFEGRLNNNAASLSWSTSSEQNSRNFDVEKSTDGTNYYKIGSVNAAGTSNTKKDYSFRDQNLSPLNYYRLRLNDNDGRYKYSNVVLINYSSAVQNVTVVNNPFSSYLDVRFAKQGAGAKLQLVGLNGAVLAEKQIANPSGQIRWPLSVNLSNGTYVLRTVIDGEIFVNKLIKQ